MIPNELNFFGNKYYDCLVYSIFIRSIFGFIFALIFVRASLFYKTTVLPNLDKILVTCIFLDTLIIANHGVCGFMSNIDFLYFVPLSYIYFFTGAFLPFYIVSALYKILEKPISILKKIDWRIKLVVYILLYWYYSVGILSHYMYTIRNEMDCGFGCAIGFVLLSVFIRPVIGFIVAIILFFSEDDSFYKQKIFANSNKIMLCSLLLDSIFCIYDALQRVINVYHHLSLDNIMSAIDFRCYTYFTLAFLPFYIVYLISKVFNFIKVKIQSKNM
ncbi:MAG: hypothetical protein NC200_07980 [Candidatus Gastranaerophilales bacterium]|nr:hypothetical protein [Candidatus Gastranaerophilales bacterium]